jgi:virginiamycin A acetyltransferase
VGVGNRHTLQELKVPIKIDPLKKARLLHLGVSTLHSGTFTLPDDSVFEPPCSIKWMRAEYSLSMGAFSYAVSGYYFAAAIGRYTSIGEDVQVGRGSHPVAWASTSPVFYQRHQDVLSLPVISKAANFKVVAPYIPPKSTSIGSDVYIGHGAFIMQGVNIGHGVVVGAQSVVTRDVPDYAVVAGSPAQIRKFRFPDNVIERMLRSAWWEYAFWDLADAPIANPIEFLDFVELKKDAGLLKYLPQLVRLKEVT